MNKYLIAALAAVTLFWVGVGTMIAQSIGPVAGNGPGNIASQFTFINGHMSFGSGSFGAPTVNAACGTGATISGSDSAFVLTSGTGSGAGCLITPAAAWNRRPVVSVDNQSSATQAAYIVSPTGVITLSGVADSSVYSIIVIGQPGG